MFRVVFYVDDKKLHEGLKALTGIAGQVEAPQYVVNAVAGPNGKLAEVTSGGLIDRIREELGKLKGTISRKHLQQLTEEQGGNRSSINYISKRLKERGVLKAIKGQKSAYAITGSGTKPTGSAQRARNGRAVVPNGNLTEALTKRLKSKKAGDKITSAEIKAFTMKMGLARSSYFNAIRALRDDGALKPTKEIGVYTIVK